MDPYLRTLSLHVSFEFTLPQSSPTGGASFTTPTGEARPTTPIGDARLNHTMQLLSKAGSTTPTGGARTTYILVGLGQPHQLAGPDPPYHTVLWT